jgi:hypothetical protein
MSSGPEITYAGEDDFFQKCKPLDENQYAHINNDRLILYAVELLEENRIEPTFEKVVLVAFKLFPKRFSLLGFPEHPDAKTVYYSLLHIAYYKRGWLSGNMKSGYNVTSKGKQILSQILTAMSGKVYVKKEVASRPERKEVYFVGLLKKSSAFQKYISGKADELTELEIRVMLRTRMDTPSEILRENFEKDLQYAQRIGESKVVEFLDYIKNSPKWAPLISGRRE